MITSDECHESPSEWMCKVWSRPNERISEARGKQCTGGRDGQSQSFIHRYWRMAILSEKNTRANEWHHSNLTCVGVSQITDNLTVYSTACSCSEKKCRNSDPHYCPLWERPPVVFPDKGQVIRKTFLCRDVIMGNFHDDGEFPRLPAT